MFCLKLDAFAVDVQEPKGRLRVVLGQGAHLRRVRAIPTYAILACAAQTRVAEAVDGRVLALVLVVFFAELLCDD